MKMMTSERLRLASFLALAGWLGSGSAVAQSCGGEGQRVCNGWKDKEYYILNPVVGFGRGCEYDLKTKDGYCVNDKRRTFVSNYPWLSWALYDQYAGIAADVPVNWNTWLLAHNAFSNTAQGFKVPDPLGMGLNQEWSITDLLDRGVRMIELDVHDFDGDTLFVCHIGESRCAKGQGMRRWDYVMREVREWMDRNPREVLIVKLDVKVDSSYYTELRNSIRDKMGNILWTSSYQLGTTLPYWPSVTEMLSQGKRILFWAKKYSPTGVGDPIFAAGDDYHAVKEGADGFNDATCKDGDGRSLPQRLYHQWALMFEGRTGSDFPNDGWNKLINANRVNFLAACSASAIGLDFIDALDKVPFDWYRESSDGRRNAMIWSWREGDHGEAGPASMDGPRWKSRDASTSMRFACALVERPKSDQWNERGWKVTTESGPFANGKDACGRLGPQYEFSYPTNGYQNRRLVEAMDSIGVYTVWLNYRAGTKGWNRVSPEEISFEYDAGSNWPLPKTTARFIRPRPIYVVSASNDLVTWVVNPSYYTPSGATAMDFQLTSAANSLAPGIYTTYIKVTHSDSPQDATMIPITVTINRKPTTLSITGPSIADFGGQSAISARVLPGRPGVSAPAGMVTFHRATAVNGSDFVRGEKVAEALLAPSTNGSSVATVIVRWDQSGPQRLIASYDGDEFWGVSSSSNGAGVYTVDVKAPVPVTTPISWRTKYLRQCLEFQTVTVTNLPGFTVRPLVDWLRTTKLSETSFRIDCQSGTYSLPQTLSGGVEVTWGQSRWVMNVQLVIENAMSIWPQTLTISVPPGARTAAGSFWVSGPVPGMRAWVFSGFPWVTGTIPPLVAGLFGECRASGTITVNTAGMFRGQTYEYRLPIRSDFGQVGGAFGGEEILTVRVVMQ